LTGPARGAHGSQCLVVARCKTRLYCLQKRKAHTEAAFAVYMDRAGTLAQTPREAKGWEKRAAAPGQLCPKGERGTEKVKQEEQKQGKTKGIIMVRAGSVHCTVAPLLLRGGARRRPLTQGGGGGRGVHALALRHKCGNQHRVLL
jgi:hypothetical protein